MEKIFVTFKRLTTHTKTLTWRDAADGELLSLDASGFPQEENLKIYKIFVGREEVEMFTVENCAFTKNFPPTILELNFREKTRTSEIKLTHNLRNSMSGVRAKWRRKGSQSVRKKFAFPSCCFASFLLCWRRGCLIASNLFGIGRRRKEILTWKWTKEDSVARWKVWSRLLLFNL